MFNFCLLESNIELDKILDRGSFDLNRIIGLDPDFLEGDHDHHHHHDHANPLHDEEIRSLSVMLDKGLVKRDERAQPHVYRAVLTREHAGRRMVAELIDKIYDGSAATLVLQALASRKTSTAELNEVRKLLDQIEHESE